MAGVSPLITVRFTVTVLAIKEIGSSAMVRGRDVVVKELASGTA